MACQIGAIEKPIRLELFVALTPHVFVVMQLTNGNQNAIASFELHVGHYDVFVDSPNANRAAYETEAFVKRRIHKRAVLVEVFGVDDSVFDCRPGFVAKIFQELRMVDDVGQRPESCGDGVTVGSVELSARI